MTEHRLCAAAATAGSWDATTSRNGSPLPQQLAETTPQRQAWSESRLEPRSQLSRRSEPTGITELARDRENLSVREPPKLRDQTSC